ncbi:MAG: FecR domain-containing protein [Betaproteobacteria bacterium]|nr:FecR domain-containing protein [Betaproteobacteria bacterium]
MNYRKSALSQAGFLLLALFSTAVFAAAGTVTHLSGTLSVQRPDGSVRILSQKSEVNPGDVLTTQRDSYAQINFTDGSSMTMRPNTQLKVEQYNFVQDRPQEDSSFLRLLKGGLRTVTGLVGKRGNQDAYKIGTNTATIGIRGSSGDTVDNTTNCEGVATGCEKLERGVYHQTYTGSYIMQNEAGTQIIGEGQFGVSRDLTSPIEVRTGEIPGVGLRDMPFVLGVGGSGRLGPGGECAVR